MGAQIECPRCKSPLVVPDEKAAALSLALQDAEAEPTEDFFAEFAVYDDPPPAEETPVIPQSPDPFETPPSPPVKDDPAAAASSQSRAESAKRSGTPAKKSSARRQPSSHPKKRPAKRQHEASDESMPLDEAAPPPPPRTAPEPPPETTIPSAGEHPILDRGSQTKTQTSGKSRGEMLLISRRTIYFQGLLIGLAAVSCLIGGILIGRGIGPPVKNPNDEDEETVEIVGSITVKKGAGAEVFEFGAVAIALPADQQGRLDAAGLGPGSLPLEGRGAAMAIEEFGGAYARTNGQGGFRLHLPRPGRYYLLLISRTAQRPKGVPIPANQLRQMQRFLAEPSNLIGQNKYAWALHEVKVGRLAVAHVF